MVAELGIADHVVFRSFGPEERGSMGKVVSEADVMCLLSDYEAHPVAVMEALGTGTPALLADTSGLTELGESGLATTIPRTPCPTGWPPPCSRRGAAHRTTGVADLG